MASIDYDLENELALQKMKEAHALRASRVVSPTVRDEGMSLSMPNWQGVANRFMEQTQGNRMEDQAIARQRDLAQQQQGEVDTYNKAISTPGTKSQLRQGEGALLEPNIDTAPLSPEEENQRQMALSLDASRLPNARKTAAQFIQSGVNFPEKQAQLKVQQDLAREQQASRLAAQQQQAAMLEEGRNQRAADTNSLRMTLGQLAASAKTSQANSRTNAAEQKQQDILEKADAAKTRSGSLLDEMDTNIDILDKNAGITNTKRGVLSNAVSWAQNTGPGQLLGKMGGTTNQNARNNIESLATSLVLELKNAKGLTGSQMNSNFELQRYLTAVAGGNNYDADSLKSVVRRARDMLGTAPASAPAPAASNEAAPTDMVRVSSPEEAAALPSGTKYIRPDGKVGVRK